MTDRDELAQSMERAIPKLKRPGDARFLTDLLRAHRSGKELSAKQLMWALKLIKQADEPAPTTKFQSVEHDIFADVTPTPTGYIPPVERKPLCPTASSMLQAGRLIDAIKAQREFTGRGLKEAKDDVEAARDSIGTKLAPDTGLDTKDLLDAANDAKLTNVIERILAPISRKLDQDNIEREANLAARQELFNKTAAKQIARATVDEALKVLDARVPRQTVITVKRVDLSEYKVSGPRHPNWEKLLKYCTVRKSDGFVPGIFLAGERGSGKTTGCRLAAEALGMTWYTNGAIAFDTQMLGYVDGGGKYHTTPFREAFEKGGFYCFDEVDRSDPNALLAVNPHLANGEAAFPDGMVRRHKDCIIVATGNTWGMGGSLEFSGATKLDEAFLSRFEIKLPWDVDFDFERKLVNNADWYGFVQECRQRVKQAGLKYTIDSRAAIVGANLIAQLGYTKQQAAEETFLPSIKPDQRNIVMGSVR